MTIAGIKAATTLLWTTLTNENVKAALNTAKSIGLNCIKISLRSSYVNIYRTASTDPIKSNIAYANSIGMKIIVLLDIDDYPANGRETFYSRLADQTRFLTDMKWAVARYNISGFAGFEMEEPHRYSKDTATAQAYRTAMNSFFVKCKALIPAGMNYGVNLASKIKATQLLQGFDTDYVIANHIFSFYAPQLAFTSLIDYQTQYEQSKTLFQSIEIMPYAYVTWSALTGQTICATSWAHPECWNQGFFDELKWLKSQNIPFGIFILERNTVQSSLFPNDTTPGLNVGEKIKYIIGTYVPPPPPPPLPENYTYSIQFLNAGGSINYGTQTFNESFSFTLPYNASWLLSAVVRNGREIEKWVMGSQEWTTPTISGNATINTTIQVIFRNVIVPPKKYKCSGAPFYQCTEDPTGTYDTLEACNASCATQRPALSSIIVSPGTATILVGESLIVVGAAIDSQGMIMGGIPIIWSSDPAGIVEIDPINTATFIDGKISTKVKGISAGMVMIKGTSGSISGQLILDVNVAPPPPPPPPLPPTPPIDITEERNKSEKIIMAGIAALTLLR